jgi:hypothetical protein
LAAFSPDIHQNISSDLSSFSSLEISYIDLANNVYLITAMVAAVKNVVMVDLIVVLLLVSL